MRLLAFDPGKRNFAYAALRDGKVVTYGTLGETVVSLSQADVQGQVSRFRSTMGQLIRLHAGSGGVVAFERMQHRAGLGGGGVVEYINVMLGVALGCIIEAKATPCPVTASQWKGWMKKSQGADPMVMLARKRAGPIGVLAEIAPKRMTPHEADAIGIGCYCWSKATGYDATARLFASLELR